MKTKNLLFFLLVSLAFTSCSTIAYQVYEVKSPGLTQKENSMVFENEDCRVLYNLWSMNGSMSFIFENKTDKDLFIDMTQTFFVKNGSASDYFMNRTFESRTFGSIGIGYNYNVPSFFAVSGNWWPNRYNVVVGPALTGANISAQKGSSSAVTIHEPEFICIPAKCHKFVQGYKIRPTFKKACDTKLDYPKSVSTIASYTMNDTPLKFMNRIAYSFEKSNKSLKFIENSFWLETIKNYSEKAATEVVKDESDPCDKNVINYSSIKVFKIGGPNQFYVSYSKL